MSELYQSLIKADVLFLAVYTFKRCGSGSARWNKDPKWAGGHMCPSHSCGRSTGSRELWKLLEATRRRREARRGVEKNVTLARPRPQSARPDHRSLGSIT
jgi:hypothetical protein